MAKLLEPHPYDQCRCKDNRRQHPVTKHWGLWYTKCQASRRVGQICSTCRKKVEQSYASPVCCCSTFRLWKRYRPRRSR